MDRQQFLYDIARKYGANHWRDKNHSVVLVSDVYDDIPRNTVHVAFYTRLIDIKWYHKIPFVAKFIIPRIKKYRIEMQASGEMFSHIEDMEPLFERTIKEKIDKLKQIRVDNFKQAYKYGIKMARG